MTSLRLPFLAAASVLAGLVATDARALDLGSVGPVHEIREVNALEFIRNKLAAMEKNGDLAKLEAEAKRRATESVRNPRPVEGLGKTESARTFYVDPSYTVPQDIRGPDGKLMYPAGFKANPLQVYSLSQHLLFFDARDAEQVKYAQGLMKHYGGRVKPILVGGSPIDLMRAWNVQVFFDQGGAMTTRFGITKVPALVSQEGMVLRVDELKVKG